MVTNAFCILNDDVDFVCNGLFCDEILSMWKRVLSMFISLFYGDLLILWEPKRFMSTS